MDLLKGARGIAAGTALAAATLAANFGTAQAAEKVTLMLNWYATGLHAPIVLGKARGYFADEGIDLDIQEGRGSGPTVQAVAARHVDIGFADLISAMALAEQGAPVKAIGVALQRSPFAVISLTETGIKSPADLKGKTIAMTAGDSPSQSWPLFLKLNGLGDKDFKVVNGDAKTKVNAVVTGQADALLGFATDQGSQIEQLTGKPVSNMLYADHGVDSLGSSFIVNTATIDKDPGMLAHFMKAATRSFEAASADPEAAVEALMAAYPNAGTKPALMSGLGTAIGLFHTAAEPERAPLRVSDADVAATVQTLVRIGTLKGDDDPVSKFWTDRFLP